MSSVNQTGCVTCRNSSLGGEQPEGQPLKVTRLFGRVCRCGFVVLVGLCCAVLSFVLQGIVFAPLLLPF